LYVSINTDEERCDYYIAVCGKFDHSILPEVSANYRSYGFLLDTFAEQEVLEVL